MMHNANASIQYNIPSEFSPKKEKGFSFGAPREAYKRVFMNTKPFIQDPSIPGPGKYDIKSFVEKIKNDPKNFTIGRKDHFNYRNFKSSFTRYST